MRMHSRSWLLLAAVVAAGLALTVAVSGIERQLWNNVQDLFGYGGPHSDKADGSRNLFHTSADIRGLKQGETYSQFTARRDSGVDEGFAGFGCLDTCKGHEEGYRWAIRQQIEDPIDCQAASWAFLEGCAAYALDRNRR